jgi:hypothetical protein
VAATLVQEHFMGSMQLIRSRAIHVRLAEISRELDVADEEHQILLFREKKLLTEELRGATGYLRKAGLRPAAAAERPAMRGYGG